MIRFEKLPEPPDFNEKARIPGMAWLEKHPAAERPRDFWTQFKPVLADGFGQLCGYSAMFEPVGTVDHYISYHSNKSLAYEWGNYRFASGWINSSKKNADDDILDPFEVGNEWFEIILPSLQLVITDRIPKTYRAKAQETLKRLHLQNDERVIRQRQAWYQMYCEGELTLAGLRKKAPLIASAIEKNRCLNQDGLNQTRK